MRWWSYAILAIALVCGSIAKADPQARGDGSTALREARGATHNTARKRAGSQSLARRLASSPCPFALPAPIDVPPAPRAWVTATIVEPVHRTSVRVVADRARGPPG